MQTFSRSVYPNGVTTFSRAYPLQTSVNILRRAVRDVCKVRLSRQRYHTSFTYNLHQKIDLYFNTTCTTVIVCGIFLCGNRARTVCADGLYAQVYVISAQIFLSALLLLFYSALNPVYRVVVVCLLLGVRLSVSHCSICVTRKCLVNGICLLAECFPVKGAAQL